MSGRPEANTTRAVFTDPIVQLAALCPFCALAALSPAAALSALSPVLRIFNPAINPTAALLSFALSNPQGAFAMHVQARVNTRLTGLIRKVYPPRMMGS